MSLRRDKTSDVPGDNPTKAISAPVDMVAGQTREDITQVSVIMLEPRARRRQLAMSNIGMVIKQQRVVSGLTLRQLSDKSAVSSSHLGRIERGERFPSARILRKIAQPLGFQEESLLVHSGYLSPPSGTEGNNQPQDIWGGLDPYVARVLSQEPAEVQRTVIAILAICKIISRKEAL